MKVERLLFWYASNRDSIDLVYIMFAGVPLFFYGIISLSSHGLFGLLSPIGLALLTILVYFSMSRICRRRLVTTVRNEMSGIGDQALPSMTSDKGTDSIDLEVLRKVQAVGGDPIQLLEQISSSAFRQDELVPRLARLCVLGYVDLYRDKLVLTPEGQEMLNMPSYLLQTHIPPEVSRRLIELRASLKSLAFAETIDKTNKLFEYLLRERLRSESDLTEKWQHLASGGIVRHQFEKCSLGELRQASKSLKVLSEGDMYDKLLGIFLALRVPQKHETDMTSDSMRAARTSLDLAEVFTRHWFD